MPVDVQHVRVLAVVRRDRPQPVRREELGLVEQLRRTAARSRSMPTTPSSRLPVARARPAASPARPAAPGRRSPSRSRNRRSCLPTACARSSSRSSTTPAASIGMMPTIERTLTGTTVAVRRRPAGRRTGRRRRPTAPGRVHRVADRGEVLEELQHEVGRGPLPLRSRTSAIVAHGQGVGRHPAGARRTARACRRRAGASGRSGRCCPARGSRPRTGWSPSASSRLTHQVKFTSSLSKTRLEEVDVAAAVDGEHLQRGPGLHRRVDVAEVPLVGGQRAVGVLEPLPAQQRSAGTWRTPGRRGPARRSGTPGPRRRTRGTPTCRAST